MTAGRLRFDRYVLDFDRGVLLLEHDQIALRPKTYGVLCHLLLNAGRLVSKEELFAAVWPNAVVTDDALVQSIGELRRALGGAGANLIATVPRRGYRFDGVVVQVAGPPLSASGPSRADDTKPLRGPRVWVVLAAALAVIVFGAVLWQAFDAPKGGTVSRRAIAVLPFLNTSGDASREYFADGLTQDLINALGRFGELTVMSWNSVAAYKGQAAVPAQAARGLAVDYLLEGSVLKTDDRVRVIAQLANAEGRVLWSERFDEPLTDLFVLQERIAAEIAAALAIRVARIEQRRAEAKPMGSLDAYDYVLRARPALLRPTRANNVEARALLRQAVQADPTLAAARVALAETYHLAVAMGWAESPTEFLERAEALATQAVALDPSTARAHVLLGRVHLFYQRYDKAEQELERALASNPNDPQAIAGRGNLMMWLGRSDAAIDLLERSLRIDPELNPIDRFALSLAYYLDKRYQDAIDHAERTLKESDQAHFSLMVLAAAYAQLGRMDDASRMVVAIRRINPRYDAEGFGSKFLKPRDLQHLRQGFDKAGLLAPKPTR